MNIDDLIQNVVEINQETNYWFVRTDYGRYFDTFVENGFIAIGWNEVTISELKDIDVFRHTIHEKLQVSENIDTTSQGGKSKLTSITNKLLKFVNLKENDVVIVPSQNSVKYAFGIVMDNGPYTDIGSTHDCEHKKRRNVRWLVTKTMQELDPMFYKMRFTQHSISSIQEYAPYIDAEIHPLFKKNNNTHLVLDIRKEGDINLEVLTSLMKSIQNFAIRLNNNYEFGESVGESSIKINVQSPGKVEFIYPIGKSIILAAILVGVVSCSSINGDSQMEQEINSKRELYHTEIKQINDSLILLEAEFQQ